jgi:thiol-disulfide isomerase/thioredoxin
MSDQKVKSKPGGSDPYGRLNRNTEQRRNMVPIIVGSIAALIAVVAVVAVLLTRGGDEQVDAGTGAAAAENATQETATVTISGEDLAAFPAGGTAQLADPSTDPAVGQTIPTLTGQSFDGSEVVIDPDDGTAKVIIFLAHWCPHCQAEVPLVRDYIDQGKLPEDVEVHSVSTSVDNSRPNYPPSAWLAREGWQPPVLLDDDAQTASASFALPGFPYFVMVGADGKVVQRGSGEIPIEQFDAAVQQLTGSSQTPTTVAAG